MLCLVAIRATLRKTFAGIAMMSDIHPDADINEAASEDIEDIGDGEEVP